jgi:CBS domain-containing protein
MPVPTTDTEDTMSIGKICCREIHLAEPGETVARAAVRMKERNVGTLVVVGADRRPIGILTDRDLVVRVLAEGRDPARLRVQDAMTGHPRTLSEATPIEDALATMRRLGVRRMPVVGGKGELVGLVSIDDVLPLLAQELGNLSRVLEHSAGGAGPPAMVAAAGRAELSGLERSAGEPEC